MRLIVWQCLDTFLLWLPLPVWAGAYYLLLFAGYPRSLFTAVLATMLTYIAGVVITAAQATSRWHLHTLRNPLAAATVGRALRHLGWTPAQFILYRAATWPTVYARLLPSRRPTHRSLDAAHHH